MIKQNKTQIKVLGVDTGTRSWDIVKMISDEQSVELSLPTARVVENPFLIIDALKKFEDFDAVAFAVGYGYPITSIHNLDENALREIALHPLEVETPDYIHVLRALSKTRLKGIVLPSVKHLPTVPVSRKINLIDLGTPDKVCAAAYAINDQAERLGISYAESSFVLVEVGTGFTAILGIRNGEIIDAVAGTAGPMGLMCSGNLDGEVACMIGHVQKRNIYGGGASTILNIRITSIDELLELSLRDELARAVYNRILEGILRAVAGLFLLNPSYKEVIVTGYASRSRRFLDDLRALAKHQWNIHSSFNPRLKVSESAIGASLIANGLVDGKYRDLVECMKLEKAAGTVKDWLFLAT